MKHEVHFNKKVEMNIKVKKIEEFRKKLIENLK